MEPAKGPERGSVSALLAERRAGSMASLMTSGSMASGRSITTAEDPEVIAAREAAEREAKRLALVEPDRIEIVRDGEADNDYAYDVDALNKRVEEHQTLLTGQPPDRLQHVYSYGFEADKRGNIGYLDDGEICFVSGRKLVLLDTRTYQQRYINSLAGYGIGQFAVHPSMKYIAVAENGERPSIYVYRVSKSSILLYRVLRKGTERAYADVCFSSKGDGAKLASLGSSPDYMLSVWDWERESVVLRCKAFSQDVFKVTFSPDNEGVLTTSGMGHIKFWKMARTFTGLKLQGQLGKFGNTELSDISGYIEFPDGKVLSGTETGNLLLWDGGLIKAELARKSGAGMHEGAVEVVNLAGNEVITAGMDGYVRVWDFETIDAAEVTTEDPLFRLEPVEEIRVGTDQAQIKAMVRGSRSQWLLQDANSGVWSLHLGASGTPSTCEQIAAYSSGRITGLTASHNNCIFAAGNADGTVRIYDYQASKQLMFTRFSAGVSSLTWLPACIDRAGTLLAVGFADGVMRLLRVTPSGLELTSALKPQTKPIVAIVYASNGQHVVTVSQDNSLFLLAVATPDGAAAPQHTAIGFVITPAAVSSACWSPDSKRVLACCSNGDVIEYVLPAEQPDVSLSYEIPLESHVLPYHGAAAATADPDDTSAPGADGNDDSTNVQARAPALAAVYMDNETFYVSWGQVQNAGRLYKCRINSTEPVSELTSGLRTSVTVLSHSANGTHLLAGTADGVVMMRDRGDLNTAAMHQAHDSRQGAVTRCVSSFDDAYVLSAGSDGSIVALRWTPVDAPRPSNGLGARSAAAPALPDEVAVVRVNDAADITSSTHYSIQEAKLKAEHDKRVAAAEVKKQDARHSIRDVQQKFQRLLKKNSAAPPDERLERKEFELDPDLYVQLEQEKQEKIAAGRAAMAFRSEQTSVLLRKLHDHFLKPVACERLVLRSLRGGHSVSTFRTSHLPDSLMQEIDATKREYDERTSARGSSGSGGRDSAASGVDGADGDGGSNAAADASTGQRTTTPGDDDGNDSGRERSGSQHSQQQQQQRDSAGRKRKTGQGVLTSAINKVEQRKQQREERARAWEALMAQRPDERYEDPQDVATIAWARENMGDYKLKSDDNYIVPEHQRVNAEKKRRQMVLLQDSVHAIKSDFNERMLALRDLGLRTVDQVHRANARICEINEELGIEEDLWMPQLADEAFPEKRDHYDTATLLAYEKSKQAAKKRKPGKTPALNSFFDAGASSPNAAGGDAAGSATSGAATAAAAGVDAGTGVAGGKNAASGLTTAVSSVSVASGQHRERGGNARRELSAMEKTELAMQHKRLVFEKEQLNRDSERCVRAYEKALDEMRDEKFKLEGDLKTTDMKMLVLFQELVLLKEFEKKDITLAKKRNAKREEKEAITAKVAECLQRLAVKKTEVEECLSVEREVLAKFNTLLGGPNNKHHEALLKVFKRKVKRPKKKVRNTSEHTGGDEDDDDFDSDSEYDEDDYDSLDDSDEDEEGDVCPPGCEEAVYKSVLQLREQRLDQEDVLAEVQKVIDVLKKDNEALLKKETAIDSALNTIDQEIQAFQTEKQRKLNELDMLVPLKLHQIHYFTGNRVPDDLRSCLVFETGNLNNLKHRIKELQQEKISLRRQQKELVRSSATLIKDRNAKQARISELEARAYDVQMLKFGQLVNLDGLERMSVNKAAEVLKAKQARREVTWARELQQWNAAIDNAKQELNQETKRNTLRMQRLAELSQRQQQLETALNMTQTRLTAEYSGTAQKEIKEREQLLANVQLQAHEIDALRVELAMLSRKGGHLYHPPTA